MLTSDPSKVNRYVELFNSIDGLILKCILVPLAPCIGLSDEPFRDITKEESVPRLYEAILSSSKKE